MKGLLRKGKGKTLVLQHGFMSSTAYWENVANTLSENFEVIALDLPGFGARRCEPAVDSVNAYVNDLLNRLAILDIDRFHLCGHSLGGMIAQELALIAPDRIDRLILYATGPDGSMPGRFESFAQSIAQIEKQGADVTIRRTTASWFLKGESDPSYPAALSLAQQASSEAIMMGYNAMNTWQSMDRLQDIKAPTLVLWPDCDQSYQWPNPQALWQGIENSSLAVIPGCAHNAHLEKPHLFNAIVKDFLGA